MSTTKQQPKTTTVRLPLDVVEAVRAIAVQHERSLSAEMRVALRQYVAEQKRGA